MLQQGREAARKEHVNGYLADFHQILRPVKTYAANWGQFFSHAGMRAMFLLPFGWVKQHWILERHILAHFEMKMFERPEYRAALARA
jgi:hypothetical protein